MQDESFAKNFSYYVGLSNISIIPTLPHKVGIFSELFPAMRV
jgi:hypothetical protein